MQPGFESWPLASGLWRREPATERWELQRDADDRLPAAALGAADTARLVGAARAADAAALVFPPEFRHSPRDGTPLRAAPPPPEGAWTPPYGDAPTEQAGLEARGLRRTRTAIAPVRPGVETGSAPRALPTPPPGAYEYLVARFGSAAEVLLALEPDHATLLAWLPARAAWLPLEREAGSYLVEASLPRERWSLELAQRGAETLLFLPTRAGLALLRPNPLGAGYAATLAEGGAPGGAPRGWSALVWAPCANDVIGVDLDGRCVHRLAVDLPPGEEFAPPIASARALIWPGRSGQLLLRKDAEGRPEAAWIAWPAGIEPRFEFGCPYLSRTGVFWQLAFDASAGSYVYVQLGRADPELQPASTPRLCTGELSVRLAQRLTGDPWLEPEVAFDASSHEAVVPLLESEHDDAVLGLSLTAETGIGELLASRERLNAVLLLQSTSRADQRLLEFRAVQPWRGRAFVYDGALWFAHPELERIAGWPLEAQP